MCKETILFELILIEPISSSKIYSLEVERTNDEDTFPGGPGDRLR